MRNGHNYEFVAAVYAAEVFLEDENNDGNNDIKSVKREEKICYCLIRAAMKKTYCN